MNNILFGTTPPKCKQSNNGGTGYGGGWDDTNRLLVGRKKAGKAESQEDEKRTKYLKVTKVEIKEKLSSADYFDNIDSLVDKRQRKKIMTDLSDIFRNQVPTDWDSRRTLYNAAFDLCRTLSSDLRLGTMFGDKDHREGVLFWLVDFSRQAEDIMKRKARADAVEWTG